MNKKELESLRQAASDISSIYKRLEEVRQKYESIYRNMSVDRQESEKGELLFNEISTIDEVLAHLDEAKLQITDILYF